jgi:hypothetical protein
VIGVYNDQEARKTIEANSDEALLAGSIVGDRDGTLIFEHAQCVRKMNAMLANVGFILVGIPFTAHYLLYVQLYGNTTGTAATDGTTGSHAKLCG